MSIDVHQNYNSNNWITLYYNITRTRAHTNTLAVVSVGIVEVSKPSASELGHDYTKRGTTPHPLASLVLPIFFREPISVSTRNFSPAVQICILTKL